MLRNTNDLIQIRRAIDAIHSHWRDCQGGHADDAQGSAKVAVACFAFGDKVCVDSQRRLWQRDYADRMKQHDHA